MDKPMEVARRRIKREAERRTGTLDLGGLGLQELPDSLFRLRDLQILLLGVWDEWGQLGNPNRVASRMLLFPKLTALRVLDLTGSDARDIAPISYLTKLRSLNIRATRVADLGPVTKIPELDALDISECTLKELPSALLYKPSLSWLGTFQSNIVGISFEYLSSTPHENSLTKLRSYTKSQRTLPTAPLLASIDSETPGEAPPDVPGMSAGQHVAVDPTGRIIFAPPSALDRQGNNGARLRSLHPVLIEAARDLVSALTPGNQPHAALLARATRYRDAVERPLEEVDFANLYALGVRLENTARATRAAAADAAEDVPNLTAEADEAAASLLALHSPFILATRDGLEMLDAEERLRLTPEDMTALRVEGLAFSIALRKEPELVEAEVAIAIRESVETIGQGQNAARGAVVGLGVTRNVIIAMTTSATVISLPVVGGLLAGPPGMVAGGVAALLGNEAVKKSKPFEALRGLLTQGIDRLGEVEVTQILSRFRQHRDFLLGQESRLRRLARLEAPFGWLGRHLDWLRRQRDPNAGRSDALDWRPRDREPPRPPSG